MERIDNIRRTITEMLSGAFFLGHYKVNIKVGNLMFPGNESLDSITVSGSSLSVIEHLWHENSSKR